MKPEPDDPAMAADQWNPYEQGWYDALLDIAALFHPALTTKRLDRKLAEPAAVAVPAGSGYRAGYTTARATVRQRLSDGTSIGRLAAELVSAIRVMRAARTTAVEDLIAEAERATKHAA